MTMIRMSEVDVQNRRVMIREDLNVPLKNGEITNDTRIQAAVPTIKAALAAGAAVIILSHLGRPEEGFFDSEHSLAPIATRLSHYLGMNVPLLNNWLNGIDVAPGQVVLCENVRFNKGEKANNPELAKQMASLCDVFVMDAFATSHRSEASTEGIIHHVPIACAGPLLSQEIDCLRKGLESPESPIVAIVGGSKVSTKLEVLNKLVKKVDVLIVGGGIANTFIAAEGYDVGTSLYEAELIDEAEDMLHDKHRAEIPMPIDVVVATALSKDAQIQTKDIAQVDEHERILDIGPKTAKLYQKYISKAKTILWNGPVGAFEIEPFKKGTESIAKAIAESTAYSIAGGGDTIAAIDQFGITDHVSYISTGGGAFLALLEGQPLPAIVALEQHARVNTL